MAAAGFLWCKETDLSCLRNVRCENRSVNQTIKLGCEWMMKNPRNDLGLTLTWWSFLTCDDHRSVKFTELGDGGLSHQLDIGFAPGNIPTGAATSQWVRGEWDRERCVLPLSSPSQWLTLSVTVRMLCPGSPYPRHRVPASPNLSVRSARSGRSGGSWSLGSRTSAGSVRSRVITYKSETTTSQGIFGKKKRDAFECQFERSVRTVNQSQTI